MRTLILIFSLFTCSAQADCYVIGDLKGYSTREGRNYEISEDAISNQKFIVEINGDNSMVTPNAMQCTQMGLSNLVCIDQEPGGKLSLETWSIYPAKGKAVYTKAIHGYGEFNGANLMIGNIKGSCN